MRFAYTPPCKGGVRVSYVVRTTQPDGVTFSDETFTVDNPGNDPIDLPTFGEDEYGMACVISASAVYID